MYYLSLFYPELYILQVGRPHIYFVYGVQISPADTSTVISPAPQSGTAESVAFMEHTDGERTEKDGCFTPGKSTVLSGTWLSEGGMGQ